MKIGVLALQGDFEAHRAMLDALRVQTSEVRTAAGLAGLDAIVLPGGESTTQLKFLQEEGLFHPLQKFAAEGGAMFGTCAGAILMAREVLNPRQESLGLIDMTVLRNGYGRQLSSEVRQGRTLLKTAPLELVFIRAPIIERIGPGVEVLAEDGGHPVLVRQGNLLAATFHPELTGDFTIYSYFLGLIGERVRV
ncbi:MAG TPA: pyridoxal 5'-phosphate synthase glutaminase subunit PdxT [Candidatus Solibacter sp.]|nr:pyridoxal 5'-phosphate synthase glutaminase subunit PdxT [Candidatus Solibacter sp.]